MTEDPRFRTNGSVYACMEASGRAIVPIFLVILYGCVGHNGASHIQFFAFQTEEALMYAAGWEADEFGIRMSPAIYPLDKDIAFLYGALRTPAASVRSLLLRSGDGGRNWEEVMTPVCGSDVIMLWFLDECTGWALVGWTVEGPGDLYLYGTSDSGRSWEKASDIPKRHYMGWPMSFEFFDERNGRMGMLYDGAAPTDGFVVIITSDGGLTWREIESLSLEEYRERQEEKKKEDGKTKVEYVSGRDGSQWKLQKQPHEHMNVLRRLHPGDEWTVMSTIPTDFRYSNGQVTGPYEEQGR